MALTDAAIAAQLAPAGLHFVERIREDPYPDYAWVRVRLAAEWDLAGSEVPALRSGFAGLFTERFVPEFTMLSLDGQMLLNTTIWGDGTISTIVIRPDRTTGDGPSTSL